MKTIIFTNKAAKELDDLPEPARTDVAEALYQYAVDGRGNIKKLQDRDGYRLRVGSYRVIFADDGETILAIYFGRRTTTTYRMRKSGESHMDMKMLQTFKTPDGTEMVIITKAEFDRLASFVDEDEEDVAIFDERMAELKSEKASLLPAEVSKMMLRGDSLIKALRKWRELNQLDMVQLTGLAQGYISDLESGKKKGTPETLRKIATALKVDPAWLDPA